MASWIYVFSKFTQEAMLFEALAFFLICAGYTAYWVLKKRKYGVLGAATPAYAVKSYLNQLIGDAEVMRVQLFGLLAGTGIDPAALAALRSSGAGAAMGIPMAAAPAAGTPVPGVSAAALAADPALAAKLAAFESKMAEQAKAIEMITIEKTRVERELGEAKAGGGGGAAAPGAGVDPKLAEKIKALEAKLQEYSVIEDDLANLKRLQQENAQLKAQLGGKAPAAAAPAAPAEAPAAATPVAEAPAVAETPAPTQVTAPEAAAPADAGAVTEAAAEQAAAPVEAAAAPAEPIASPTGDANFEGLVDQVEKSLDPAAATAEAPAGASVVDPAAPPAAAVDPVAAEASAAATAPPADRSDADLVAEFEKMLNS